MNSGVILVSRLLLQAFVFPHNAICALGPHREVVGSLYPQKQEPHLGHTVPGYSAWPGPSSPASCFDTAPPFAEAVEKMAQSSKSANHQAVFFQSLHYNFHLPRTIEPFMKWPLSLTKLHLSELSLFSIVLVVSLCCFAHFHSHRTALYARSTKDEHVRRPQDEQIW